MISLVLNNRAQVVIPTYKCNFNLSKGMKAD